jgi:hypothetical protein
VVALSPGGQAREDGVVLHPGDTILGVEVRGRVVPCGAQPLAAVLPRARQVHTLLVRRKPPIAAESAGASAPHAHQAPTSSFEVRVRATPAPPEAAGVAAWPTPREHVPATPAAPTSSMSVALPRPPPETVAALKMALRHL